jgi:hypothetical protein
MIKYLLVQCSIVVLPLLIGLSIFAGHKNCASSLPTRWFVGLFFLIIILTAAISVGFGFDVIFANPFEVSIASLVTSLVIVTMRLYGLRRVTAPSRLDATSVRPVGPLYEAIRLSIVLLLLFYGFSEVIKVPVNEWDAVFIWFNKAKSIYYGDLWNKTPFAEYPNSGPLVWAFLMRLFGQTEQIGRLVFPTIYVFCCWQFSYFDFKNQQRFLYFLICWSVLSLYLFKSWAWNGYQDNFIACTAAVAVYIFTQSLYMAGSSSLAGQGFRGERGGSNISSNRALDSVAFLFCGMLYLIKNEGLVLGAIICLTYLSYSANERNGEKYTTKKIIINIILFFTPIAFQLFIKFVFGINPLQVQGDAFSLNTNFSIQERMTRFLPIGLAFCTYVWQNLFIYSVCLTSTYCSIKYYKNITKNVFINSFLVIIIVLHSFFIVAVFIVTNQNLEWHLMTAYGRLMSQHLMIVYALTLWNLSMIINHFKGISNKTQ